MTAFPKFPESPSSQIGQLLINRYQRNLRLRDEEIEVTNSVRAVVFPGGLVQRFPGEPKLLWNTQERSPKPMAFGGASRGDRAKLLEKWAAKQPVTGLEASRPLRHCFSLFFANLACRRPLLVAL